MFFYWKSSVLSLLILTAIQPLSAQWYPEQYLNAALENNPGIQAMYKSYEAALQQTTSASSLPDPQLTAGLFVPAMQRFMGNQWFDVGIMQMFPWFGTLSAQKNAAQKMADASWHLYRQERNELFMEITRSWLQIFQTQQQIDIAQQYIETLKNREDIVYSRYQAGQQGQGMAADLYRLQIQIADLENQIEKLTEEKMTQSLNLNILTGGDPRSPVDIPQALPERPRMENQDEDVIFSKNPMFQMREAETEAATWRQDIARLNNRPMMGIGLQYSYLAPGEAAMGQMDGGHMLMPMLSATIPLYGKKNRSEQLQSTLRAESASLDQTNQLITLQTGWNSLMARLRNLERDEAFYNRQLEILYKTFDLVLSGYAAGFEGFEEMLRLQDQMLDLEWRLIETRIELLMAHAESDMLRAIDVFE